MIVNSPRIFGKKDKFFTVKSKVLKRRRGDEKHSVINTPLGIITALLLIPALLFGGRYLVDSLLMKSRFIVDEIIVKGNDLVPVEVILSAAKIEKGADLIKFDIYAAKIRIEKIPQILSASIVKKLPDTIIINVVERSARAKTKSRISGAEICVDAEGVLLPAEASGGIDDMTSISGVELKEVKPGKYSNDTNLLTALEVLRLHDLSKLKERINVEDVTVTNDGQVILHDREKKEARRLYTVYLGKDDFPQKIANLAEILLVELERNDKVNRTINLIYERPVSVPTESDGGSEK